LSERYEPPGLEELVGENITADVRRADELLRAVPAPPPELPRSLQSPAPPPAEPVRIWTRRRKLVAIALAAALAALSFGIGTLVSGDDFESVASYPMAATPDGEGASATLVVGKADADGNRPVRLESAGLPKLPEGGYYVLWLEKDGDYAGTCGTFAGGEAEWTVSYNLWDYDAWIVSARLPDQPPEDAKQVLRVAIGDQRA
jgi:hypothetical protein